MKDERIYTVSVNGKRYTTRSRRRFLNHTRTIKWEKSPSVYLRVKYGLREDVNGELTMFNNEGTYNNKEDFEGSLKAFMEEV